MHAIRHKLQLAVIAERHGEQRSALRLQQHVDRSGAGIEAAKDLARIAIQRFDATVTIADDYAFVQGFEDRLLLGQQTAQHQLLTNRFGCRLHRAERMRIKVVRRGGQREYAQQLAAGIAHRCGSTLAMAFAQIQLPVFAAQHVHQPLLNQAARGAVGAEHLFAQDAADRRQIRAAEVQRHALRIGQIDVAIRVIRQQVFHDAARREDQLGIVLKDRRQFRSGWRNIGKGGGIDRALLRSPPRLQNAVPHPAGLFTAFKAVPALPQQRIPFAHLRAVRQAEDWIALIFKRQTLTGTHVTLLNKMECTFY